MISISKFHVQIEWSKNGRDFTKYLKNKNEYTFFLHPTEETEIIDIIKSINVCKVSGPHSIPSDILKLIKKNIGKPLAGIVNLSFGKGEYLVPLKTSKTVPVFKEKGSKLTCSNYRPISLLSNVNKIFEKLMYRLDDFLLKHNCNYDLQFGFREKHSTTHALLNLTENIRNALDKNGFSVGVFIDLQKAFDTVDHKILLDKRFYYGIRGTANQWFKSYLENRQQFVTINGYNSEEVIGTLGSHKGQYGAFTSPYICQ